MKNRLSRRTMLCGAGAAIALPLLEAMMPKFAFGRPSTYKAAAKSLAAKPRMICCYVSNGVNVFDWFPSDDGPNWTLSPTLRSLEPYKSDFTLLSGLGHFNGGSTHDGADIWLTGADLKGTPGKDYQNSISVDQVVAEHHGHETRFPSIELGNFSGTGTAGHSHTLAFNRNGIPLPAENTPHRLFNRLFVSDDTGSRETTLERLAERRSILDEILSDAKSLRRELGNTDQRKLDEYLNSVREAERRVERMEGWVDVPKPQVAERGLALTSDPLLAHDREMWLDVMLDLSYLAFQTDTTRVITFEWAREAAGYGRNGENHHELSHHGGDPGMLQQLAGIDRFYVSRLARFLGLLKSTSETDGNMLDRTIVLFGSGMSSGTTGTHSPKNLPLLLAGGTKLGLKQGQHLKHEIDSIPFSNVLLTMLQKMGVESDSFSDSSGTLTGIT